MIDLMWRIRIVLVQKAVLTSVSRALCNESARLLGDISAQT